MFADGIALALFSPLATTHTKEVNSGSEEVGL